MKRNTRVTQKIDALSATRPPTIAAAHLPRCRCRFSDMLHFPMHVGDNPSCPRLITGHSPESDESRAPRRRTVRRHERRPTCPEHPAHPRSPGTRADDVRREGSRHVVPTDRAAAAPRGRAERAGGAARRRRLRRLERLRRTVPDADGGTARGGRAAVQPVPHHGPVRPHPPGPPDRTQPPLGGHGQHHRDGDLRAGQQLAAAEHQGTTGDDPAAERVLHRPVRQVPRGTRLAVLADGSLRRLAVRRWRLRDLLRLHRRRDQPVGPRALRRHHPC